ncbi:hypothetical protein Hdeb2414_s0032g00716911 [Helianthus debilis subsp. tardiflorus]
MPSRFLHHYGFFIMKTLAALKEEGTVLMEEQYDLKRSGNSDISGVPSTGRRLLRYRRFHGRWFGRRRQRRFLAPGLQGKHRVARET